MKDGIAQEAEELAPDYVHVSRRVSPNRSFRPLLVRANTRVHSGTTMQTLLCKPFA